MKSADPKAGDKSPLRLLHAEIDAAANPLHQLHRDRLHCHKGCHGCCVDDLTVFSVEAAEIQNHYPALLAQGKPHPKGGCAFLDADGGCRIYAHRPYVCRTQGLPLRFFAVDNSAQGEDDDDWEMDLSKPIPASTTKAFEEHRDICPEHAQNFELDALDASACWEIGPYEDRLAALQAQADPKMPRVSLRSLFAASWA